MTAMFEGYGSTGPAYEEMFDGAALRSPYRRLSRSLQTTTTPELVTRVEALAASYLDQSVTFDIGGEERLHRTCALATEAVTRRYAEVEITRLF